MTDQSSVLTEQLSTAIAAGDVSRCRLLIDAGADIHADIGEGERLLAQAARYGQTEICRLLIACGADVNQRSQKHYSAMHAAVIAKNEEVCQMLLDAGFKFSFREGDDYAPLHMAARAGVKISEQLIRSGEDIHKEDKRGKTPLMWAVEYDMVDVCRLLVGLGASPSALPSKGELTPFQAAVKLGQLKALRYFVEVCHEDVAQRTSKGQTMLQLARDQPEAAAYLRSVKTGLVIRNALCPQEGFGEPTVAKPKSGGMVPL